MFSKVLVAEDVDSINLGLISSLKLHFDIEADHVKYCDDALLKLKKALADQEPYELLITDLSFKPDHREVKITSGEELVAVARELQPDLKVIMYSIEDRPQRIRSLISELELDGYISKGRNSTSDFAKALPVVARHEFFLSPELDHLVKLAPVYEVDAYDLDLLRLLAQGMSQEEISIYFRDKNVSPSSLSSVEKRLNKLKIHFKAKNAIHLIAMVKDLGLL